MTAISLERCQTIVVVSSIDEFSNILRWSKAAFSQRKRIIPIQSEREVRELLEKESHALLVIDTDFPLSSQQEKLMHFALAKGMHWCSMKIYQGALRGFAHIESLRDLLEWVSHHEMGMPNVWLARAQCLMRRCIALSLLTLMSPVLIAISLMIKSLSPGPIIYKQKRIGFRGKEFTLYKFRTMHIDAESTGPQWSTGSSDPRTFPFGRFLRQTHLDELPQLWNVIRGDLCFIGPRPERPEFHELLDPEIPHFKSRTRVKPGITGWSQILAGYAASVEDSKRKIAHDLFFMRYSGLALSIRISTRTVAKILREMIDFAYQKFIVSGRFTE